MNDTTQWLRKNRTLLIILAVLVLLFILAARGMDTDDWVITTLRGLAVGAVTFLAASGFSLIFGLMNVLNLAHGTMFMIGAYIAWTFYVRPDSVVDIMVPFLLLMSGIFLRPLISHFIRMLRIGERAARIWPWIALLLGLALAILIVPRFPISAWDPGRYDSSPIWYATLLDREALVVPEVSDFDHIAPGLALLGSFASGALLAASLAGFAARREGATTKAPLPWKTVVVCIVLIVCGVLVYLFNTGISEFVLGLNSTVLFLLAVVVATLSGAGLGGLMEVSLIRSLGHRHFYQILMTLGVQFMGLEIVRAIWGRPEFTMPKPSLFKGSGDGCPATSIGDWFTYHCTTIKFMGSRVRVYNEVFLIIAGVVVLVAVWLLLQRTRLGMIIRAGVQDSQMVEALGINVRSVFTLVFALGVGLAALGGALAGPSVGVSNGMAQSVLLNTLVALAIGGLTSYPGAAVGSVLVGLLQQFIIKYGSIGIKIPFLAEPFKPTPPLVPASTVLLMVIVLLVMPQGLFGRKE